MVEVGGGVPVTEPELFAGRPDRAREGRVRVIAEIDADTVALDRYLGRVEARGIDKRAERIELGLKHRIELE